jgi:hypothetical protein
VSVVERGGGGAHPSGLRVLRDRNFWPYFAGNLLSNCGTWFQNLAQALLIYRLVGRHRAAVERRLAVTLAVLSAGMVAFAVAPDVAVALPALALGGFGYLAANTTATTAIQLGVDDAQRGRVMALWSVAFLGLRPFGSLADGAVVTAAGPRAAALVMVAPAAVVTGVFVLRARGRTVAEGRAVPDG